MPLFDIIAINFLNMYICIRIKKWKNTRLCLILNCLCIAKLVILSILFNCLGNTAMQLKKRLIQYIKLKEKLIKNLPCC